MHITLHVRPDGQNGRRDLQGRGVVLAFEVGREEERRAVDEGKGVRGVEDGVAECLQDAAVERGEDWILEDYVWGGAVGFACLGGGYWLFGVLGRGGEGERYGYVT